MCFVVEFVQRKDVLDLNVAPTLDAYLDLLVHRKLNELKDFWMHSLQYESPQGRTLGYLPAPKREKGSRQRGHSTSIDAYNQAGLFINYMTVLAIES